MSIAILDAFLRLIEENPEAIENYHELHQQVNGWSDDVDELADRVAEYCQGNSDLHESLKSMLGNEQDRLPGNATKAPSLQPEDYKYTILNTMHKVFSTPVPAKKS
jgi:hypothetical protein